MPRHPLSMARHPLSSCVERFATDESESVRPEPDPGFRGLDPDIGRDGNHPARQRPGAIARPLDCAGGARREVRVLLEFKGSQAKATIKTPHGVRLLLTGEVKLDATTSPRRLDWINFTGADQQEFPPLLGIYTLEGNRFTVCNGGLNRSRPTEFKPGDGILAEVVVFEREPSSVADGKSKTTTTAVATVKK